MRHSASMIFTVFFHWLRFCSFIYRNGPWFRLKAIWMVGDDASCHHICLLNVKYEYDSKHLTDTFSKAYTNALVQNCSISTALAMKILQSCIEPVISLMQKLTSEALVSQLWYWAQCVNFNYLSDISIHSTSPKCLWEKHILIHHARYTVSIMCRLCCFHNRFGLTKAVGLIDMGNKKLITGCRISSDITGW